MDWRSLASDMAADVKRWLGQALREWGESIRADPVEHLFSLVAGAVMYGVVQLFF